MKRASVHIAVTVLAFAAAVALSLSLRVAPPDSDRAGTPLAAPTPSSADPGSTIPAGNETESAVRVVGSGRYFEDVLPRTLPSVPGIDFEILALGSDSLVWDLLAENRRHADVIEVGFRLDALSGAADDSLLPIDPGLIPSLTAVDPALRLDVNGIVPAIDGALGLFTTTDEAPSDWNDLVAEATEGSTVVIPGPPASIAVVFVWALGGGDPAVGLERYGTLVESGAIIASNSTDLMEALGEGPVIGGWSSAGIVRAGRTVSSLEFVVPGSGAILLPGFAGIPADTDRPEDAHRWLEHRLGAAVQEAMTFGAVNRRFNAPVPVPPLPVISLGRDARPLTGFDPHSGDMFTVLDWVDVAASADSITERLEAMTGS